MVSPICANLEAVRTAVEQFCVRSKRKPEEITLIGVSKTFPADAIREAVQCGLTDVGESRVQEVLPKLEELRDLPVRWHFIGHLQRNKVRHVVGRFWLIHSVDSLRLAEELQKECEKKWVEQDILIEVNCSGEESKFGIMPEKTEELVRQVANLNRIHVKGLMTIGKLTENEQEIRQGFRLLRQLFEHIRGLDIAGVEMRYLSMGMSDDFHLAIEEGSNMIRIGRKIFGDRR